MPLHNPRPMKRTNHLNALPIQTLFSGTYRIANKRTGMNENGTSYVTCELHDATGMKAGICHPNAINWYQNNPFQLVYVKGYVLYSDQKIVHITEIKPVNNMGNVTPFLRLPSALCANPNNLNRLLKIRQNILSPALGQFIDTVFSDDDIAFAFIDVPASKNHHHNHAGGLLAHSIEVAEIVSALSYDSAYERDIAIVAALLHDIGKIRTLNPNITNTKLGKLVNHDALTLEICATALKELDKTWPDASYTLRHVWTCASPGARYGFKSMCLIADIVRNADNQSCSHYDIQKAFQHKLVKTGLIWAEHKQQHLWYPAAEPRQLNGVKYA